jgi:hypothetical protein
MWWRALAAIFGALPATALGVMAFAALIAGSQGFAADTFLAALFFVWGALGVAGVVGLWLAIFEQTPRLAGSLTACGLIAVAPVVALAFAEAFAGQASWLLLTVLPFGVGAVLLVGTFRKLRRRRATNP